LRGERGQQRCLHAVPGACHLGLNPPAVLGQLGDAREGWDHSTAYLRRILADVWGADLTVVEREFTLVGVNPALDDFNDLAAQFKDAAHAAAAMAGKSLASEAGLGAR
jgi:FMN-dependent NADH-azoreductase